MKKEYTNTTKKYQVVGNTSIVLLEGTKKECLQYLKDVKIENDCKNEDATLCLVAPGETICRTYGKCCGACDQRPAYEDVLKILEEIPEEG